MSPSLMQILIVVVLVLIFFGRGRISNFMSDLASGIKSFRKGLEDDVSENEIENDTLDKWLDEHRFYTLQTLYQHFPKCVMTSKENCNMRCYDYNHYVFEKFLNVEPIITVEYFYICIGYIFNINYSIKNMISKMLNEKNLIGI